MDDFHPCRHAATSHSWAFLMYSSAYFRFATRTVPLSLACALARIPVFPASHRLPAAMAQATFHQSAALGWNGRRLRKVSSLVSCYGTGHVPPGCCFGVERSALAESLLIGLVYVGCEGCCFLLDFGDTLAARQHREMAVRAERGSISGRGGVIRRIGPIAQFQRYQGHDAQSSGALARAETSSAHRPEG